MKFSWTRVLNITGFAVTGLAMIFHFNFSSSQIGSIALLVFSVANLFTEGGVRQRKISGTVITNGLAALFAIATAAGWLHLSGEQASQVTMLVLQVVNLFTEGGLVDVPMAVPPAMLFLSLGLAIIGTGH